MYFNDLKADGVIPGSALCPDRDDKNDSLRLFLITQNNLQV